MNLNQTHQAFLRQLLCLLDEAAVEPQLFTTELKRRGITRPFAVEGEDALVLLEAAVDLSGDPSLMIRLGQELGIKSYGSFGFALMSCANVRESIQLLLRYGQVLFRPSWEVHELKGGLILRAQITKGPRDNNNVLPNFSLQRFLQSGAHCTAVKWSVLKGPKFSSPTNSHCIQLRITKLLRRPSPLTQSTIKSSCRVMFSISPYEQQIEQSILFFNNSARRCSAG
jgi:hypothetical protein